MRVVPAPPEERGERLFGRAHDGRTAASLRDQLEEEDLLVGQPAVRCFHLERDEPPTGTENPDEVARSTAEPKALQPSVPMIGEPDRVAPQHEIGLAAERETDVSE
jgi:hypothetical protein